MLRLHRGYGKRSFIYELYTYSQLIDANKLKIIHFYNLSLLAQKQKQTLFSENRFFRIKFRFSEILLLSGKFFSPNFNFPSTKFDQVDRFLRSF